MDLEGPNNPQPPRKRKRLENANQQESPELVDLTQDDSLVVNNCDTNDDDLSDIVVVQQSQPTRRISQSVSSVLILSDSDSEAEFLATTDATTTTTSTTMNKTRPRIRGIRQRAVRARPDAIFISSSPLISSRFPPTHSQYPAPLSSVLPPPDIVEPISTQPPRPPPPSSPPNALKCPICIETYVNVKQRGLKIVTTKCGHIFCDFCLKKALTTNGRKCPKCRKTVPKAGIIEIFDVC